MTSVDRIIEEACFKLEEAWSHIGLPPDIGMIVSKDTPDAGTLLTELIPLDIAFRADRGIPVSRSHYLASFPSHRFLIESICNECLRDDSLFSCYEARNDKSQGNIEVPAAIGKYKITSHLGSGGQGDVFRAVHPMLEQDVVVKITRQAYSSAGRLSRDQQLIDEARLLMSLDHPNICRVLDLDVYQGRPFIVMNYVEGKLLSDCDATEEMAIKVMQKLADAVDYAHGKGVVHQDIKPRNVVIESSGNPVLIDFGLARVSGAWSGQNELIAGTPNCLAPEQARNENRIGPWTDVFGLGGILYFMATKRPLYGGKSLDEVLQKARDASIEFRTLDASDFSSRTKRVCRIALDPDPPLRFRSAKSLGKAISRKRIQYGKIALWILGLAISVAINFVIRS